MMPSPPLVELLPGRVVARLFTHEIVTDAGLVPCWSYVTAGLERFGQREVSFTLLRPKGVAREKVPQDPLQFLQAVARLAEQGHLVDAGGFTQVGSHGILRRPALRGVAYTLAPAMVGVDLPYGCLAAVVLVGHEMDVVKRYGTLRVLGRIGRAYTYFPTAAWCDPDRDPLMPPDEQTILQAARRLEVPACAVLEGDQLVVRMTRSALPRIAGDLAQVPPDDSLALLTTLDPESDACLVWSPGQRGPYAISPPGSAGLRVSGCFVLFVPGQATDGCNPFEDGFAAMLTTETWRRLRDALTAGAPFAVPSTEPRSQGIALEWVDPPVIGHAAASMSEQEPQEMPAGPLTLQLVWLYTPDTALPHRVPGGVPELSTFMKALQRRLAEHYLEVSVGPTSRALVVALGPRACRFWLLAPEGTAPEESRVHFALEALRRPTVIKPVAFALICDLGAKWTGGPPTPEEWRAAAQAVGGDMALDAVLAKIVGG